MADDERVTPWTDYPAAWELYSLAYYKWLAMRDWARAHPERMDRARWRRLNEVARVVERWQWQFDRHRYLTCREENNAGKSSSKRRSKSNAGSPAPDDGTVQQREWDFADGDAGDLDGSSSFGGTASPPSGKGEVL